MDFVAVGVAALFASLLTMFSGFGLGTLLLPVFALFLPIELAVGATAVLHGANNVLKAALLGRLADRELVLRFGLPAVGAALLGAWALGLLSTSAPLARYVAFGATATVTPLKLVMALVMAGFALFELGTSGKAWAFPRRLLPLGGLLSGFFGGLSGHQGALRSAFLARLDVAPDSFVGTNAVIGLLVDLTRLAVYAALVSGGRLSAPLQPRQGWLIAAGVAAAFAGVLLGKRWLQKLTMRRLQRLTGVMLLFVAALLGAGLV